VYVEPFTNVPSVADVAVLGVAVTEAWTVPLRIRSKR
jgi:hypothetical protein